MREDWIDCKFEDILTLKNGFAFKSEKYSDEGTPIIRISDINDAIVKTINSKKIQDEENYESYLVEFEDILIAMSGATTGKFGIYKEKIKAYQNQRVGNFKPHVEKLTNKKYIYYLLYALRRQIEKDAYGGAQPNISSKKIEAMEITLAPLLEQKAIVVKIEQLFSELDKGIESLKTAQAKLKIYRQAVLKKAFEGELTKKWINVKNNWNFYKIGDICNCIVPNRDKPKSFSGNTKWVTTPNLNQDSIRIDYSNITLGLSDKELAIYKAKVIPKGSVIMTCVGTFGVSAIVEEEIVINQQLHAFLPSDKILNKYLAYLIKYNKNYFEKKATATTVAYLNKTNCNSMPVNLPSIHEQTQIVQEIESRLSVCDKIEETIQNSLTKAEALRQSILKKAFEGKLLDAKEIEAIKNHPEYEGAEKLLQRIKLERAK